MPQPSSKTLELANAYATEFPANHFTHVVGSSVLHHLDVDQALAECLRVLAPNGALRFTEPNMMNPQIAIQKNVPAIKKWLGDSEDETAFFRFQLRNKLTRCGFTGIRIVPFDFLHPKTPGGFANAVGKIGLICERLPLIQEIAGSLFIEGSKPK